MNPVIAAPQIDRLNGSCSAQQRSAVTSCASLPIPPFLFYSWSNRGGLESAKPNKLLQQGGTLGRGGDPITSIIFE